jgi:hypothetical protein
MSGGGAGAAARDPIGMDDIGLVEAARELDRDAPNGAGLLTTGECPLRRWLRNAAALAPAPARRALFSPYLGKP